MVGHTACGGLGRDSPNSSIFSSCWGGIFFSRFGSPMTWLTPNLWLAWNLVILMWWLGTRLMSLPTPGWQNVSWWHIYPSFMGKVSSLTHCPLEPGCENYSFLDQGMADFEQGVNSILTNSVETLGLDASLKKPDIVLLLVSSGFLHSIITISYTSKPQLASSIKSHWFWCLARALLIPVPMADKMSASTLIWYFSSHPAVFGFQSSLPPDIISLNPANRKTYQSLSNFQTSIGAAFMPLLIWRSLFLVPEQMLLIPLPLSRILMGNWYQSRQSLNYSLRFMIFWTMLCLGGLGIQLIFWSSKEILLWNRTLVVVVDKLSSTTVDLIRSEGELKNCALYGF